MGRGATATIKENLLYGPAAPRRRRPGNARSKEDLRLARPSLSALGDEALLAELSDAEIISVFCDPEASSAFKTRLAVLIRDGGWQARIPAGTQMIRELHPRRSAEPLKRSQVVKVGWIFSSYMDANAGRVIVAQIRWAGSGGYWRDAELHQGVELIRPGCPEA